MAIKFKIGDRVYLPVKDAPIMIVQWVYPRPGDEGDFEVHCMWFDSSKTLQVGSFKSSMLELDERKEEE